MENQGGKVIAIELRESLGFQMENPFSLKFGQVFTGFGIGCGIGIGVGRPIYLDFLERRGGQDVVIILPTKVYERVDPCLRIKFLRQIVKCAIPMLQQVMSATRGATDAFSGVGQHVNSSLRKIGMKNIEAGVGCGVGIGHGFGVGIALKPGVINRIQSSVVQAVTGLTLNMGLGPSLSSMQTVVPGSFQSSVSALTSIHGERVQSSTGTAMDLASKNTGSSYNFSRGDGIVPRDPTHNAFEGKGSFDRSSGSRTELVLDSFLQSPIFKREEDTEVNKLAEKLRAENNVLQVLLKQQQTIQGLMEENQKLQNILVEDLKVSPSKLRANSDSFIKSNSPCSECFECSRRKRKTGR